MRFAPSLLVASFLLTAACAPDPGPGGDGLIHATWEEDSDDDNNFPTDAETVTVEWTGSVTIEGSMSDCDWDNSEDWPWQGDEDYYEIEVPQAGYIDVVLSWDNGSDIDMLIWFEAPNPGPLGVSPDEQLTASDDDGEIEYLFDDPYERGDDLVIGVLCAQGGGGDYQAVVGWES